MNEETFFAFAAQVFDVPRETAFESTPQLNSINHLRLVMETEAAFGVHYPLARIPRLKPLGDFLNP